MQVLNSGLTTAEHWKKNNPQTPPYYMDFSSCRPLLEKKLGDLDQLPFFLPLNSIYSFYLLRMYELGGELRSWKHFLSVQIRITWKTFIKYLWTSYSKILYNNEKRMKVFVGSRMIVKIYCEVIKASYRTVYIYYVPIYVWGRERNF